MSSRLALVVLLAIGFAGSALAADEAEERIQTATTVFNEIMATPDKGIPRDLLAKAHCVAIVPSMKRAGFVVGVQYGVGVALCRKPGGAGWTGPSTVRMEGGSIGALIGAGETDVVLMVMNETGANKLMKSEFTLGAEGAAMAGPVGRAATAETDAYLQAEVLSYSRSRGLFAGVALKGSTLRADDSANASIYGKATKHEDILHAKVAAPASANKLIDALTTNSRIERK